MVGGKGLPYSKMPSNPARPAAQNRAACSPSGSKRGSRGGRGRVDYDDAAGGRVARAAIVPAGEKRCLP